jgi:phage shock protein PspC (stress-responsive transcriptional regulator)
VAAVADRLYRSPDDRMLTGVAGGVAEALDADPSIVRIVWVLLAFLTGGIAVVVYIVMAIVVPERPPGVAVGGYRAWGPAGDPAAATRDPSATGTGPAIPGDPAAPGTPAAELVPEGSWRAPDGSTVPLAQGPRTGRPPRDPADRARLGFVLGLVLIGLGAIFLVQRLLPEIDFSLWWPLLAIAAGVVLLVVALAPPRRQG